ncbi:hypothetical protein LZ190_27175, partial [Rhodovulum sulfidophilum]|nr:hypothetical protein [Rhodovulum sulfidophilum]
MAHRQAVDIVHDCRPRKAKDEASALTGDGLGGRRLLKVVSFLPVDDHEGPTSRGIQIAASGNQRDRPERGYPR